MDPGLGTHLPAPIHPPDAVAGVAAAVAQANPQVGIFIHYPAKDETGKGNGPVGQVADGVGQVIFAVAGADHRRPILMNQHNRAQLLRRRPQGEKLRVIVGFAVDIIANHRPLQPQLRHGTLQFRHRRRHILHRQVSQAGKAGRIVPGQLGHIVVALPIHRHDGVQVPVVAVEKGVGGQDVDIDAQGIHILEAFRGRPHPPGGIVGKAGGHQFRREGIIAAALAHGPQAIFRGNVGVDVNATHRGGNSFRNFGFRLAVAAGRVKRLGMPVAIIANQDAIVLKLRDEGELPAGPGLTNARLVSTD